MKLSEYQQAASRTAPKTGDLAYFALKLSAEAGEAVDLIAKFLHQGAEFDRDRLREELGDTLWALAGLARVCGLDLDAVAKANVEKIATRFPAASALKQGDIIREG